jgi:pyridoxal phosphate enzyme (YggS family)
MDLASHLAQTHATILARIADAARRSGRSPDSITLVAVSKQQPDARIDALIAAGQRVFGENRVQEAAARWAERRHGVSELRLVGALQTNKAAQAAALFDAIDTLDRPSLAAALAEAAQKQGHCPHILIQVNTGEEPQKSGVLPSEADRFIGEARDAFGLPVVGLMCIPPVDEPGAMHFALLARIAERNGLRELSMGMSDDFETAIQFGATQVRIGSLLFGAREKK